MDQDVWNNAQDYLGQAARMIAAALISAVISATLVIIIGQSLLNREPAERATSPTPLIRTAG